MRIALVIERMDVERGGREGLTAQIALALGRRGHEVTVLCQSGRWTGGPGVSVEALGIRGLERFIPAVQQRIARREWDVVHAMFPMPSADVYQLHSGTIPGQRAARRLRYGRVFGLLEPLGSAFRRRQRRVAQLERQVMSEERCVCVAPSSLVAREIERHYARTAGVKMVYNAVDVPDVDAETRADWRQRIRYSLRVTPQDTVFVCMARNFRLKGVASLIEHYAAWHFRRKRPGASRLVIVGQDDVEGYRRHAGLRQVGGNVVFVPFTSDVFQYLSAADAAVLLSWYDPCSLVVLEAVRWGVPAITTAFNGASEILSDGAGIVVSSPLDRKETVAAMEAMSDPDTRARATLACLRLNEFLAMDRHVDELLEVYQQVGHKR